MVAPSDFRFHHRLRVRWAEVDAQQVVFNGHYLTYLDVAISEFWRQVGLPYPEGFAHVGGDIFVRRNTLEYHAPARLDDWLDVGVRCERIGNSSITMCWAAWCHGRLLVTGEVVYVHVGLQSGRATQVPEVLRRQLNAHEEGRSVHTLQIGDWDALSAPASSVRRQVFIQEQGISESDEWDDDDVTAIHAVVCNLAGLPLATGRLILSGEGEGEGEGDGRGCARIGRMAVLRSSRGIGLGRQVLRALIDQARQRGVRQVSLNAQVAAMPLYAREGFIAQGPVFDEVGIPHQRMVASI